MLTWLSSSLIAQGVAQTQPSVGVGYGAFSIVIAAFTSALVTGLFLVGNHLYVRRHEKQRLHDEQWTKTGLPVLIAAEDLIARLFDVLIRGRPLEPLPDLNSVDVFNPPRPVSTVWRLLQYLGAAAALERCAFEGGGASRLENLKVYTSHARIALKGNVFGSPLKIQTEAQEAIGAKILFLDRPSRQDPTDFYDFARAVPKDSELRDVVNQIRRVFELPGLDTGLTPQLLTVAYFGIYLIDAVQDLRPTSKWEEFRVFLVSLIRTWNRTTTGSPVYLYALQDLASPDYFDTYAMSANEYLAWRWTPNWFTAFRRRLRIRRRANLGFDRTIAPWGVIRRTRRGQYRLPYDGTPMELLVAARAVAPGAG